MPRQDTKWHSGSSALDCCTGDFFIYLFTYLFFKSDSLVLDVGEGVNQFSGHNGIAQFADLSYGKG